MDQEHRPLYGVLVTAHKNQSGVPEAEAAEGHIRSMIEEAAYYLAEKRGFAPGHELEDWLKAKTQILNR